MASSLKRILLFTIIAFSAFNAIAIDEYKRLSPNEIKNCIKVQFKADEYTEDGTLFIYHFYFSHANGLRTLTIHNPSDGNRKYEITNFAGSLIRKEFWLRDMETDEKVSLVMKIIEDPKARNCVIYEVKLDNYPGRRPNQKSINAIVTSKYNIKNSYGINRFLFSIKNDWKDKNIRIGDIENLFDFFDFHFYK